MSKSNNRVGILGLGGIGREIAHRLLSKDKFHIVGYDRDDSHQESFVAKGGKGEISPCDAAKGSEFLICAATNFEEVSHSLFDGQAEAAKGLPTGAVVLICSSVSPDHFETLRAQLNYLGRHDVLILDCPVTIGTEPTEGSLTMFISGEPEAIEQSNGLIKDISDNAYHIHGGLGSASKVNLVNILLTGIHNATAAEAIALATEAGLSIQEVYDIIVGPTAGDSRAFESRVPRMMERNWSPQSTIEDWVNNMGLVTSTARSLKFPMPMSSIVEQLYTLASARGCGKDHDAGILRVFTPTVPCSERKDSQTTNNQHMPTQDGKSSSISQIGFIGLGAMGYGMATSLVRAGFPVTAFDVYLPCVDKFITSGKNAKGVTTAAEATSGADLIVMMVQNAAQVEDILFGAGRAIESISDGATILLSSTVPNSFIQDLALRLGALGKEINLVDAPVSGGAARAATGDLTFICSGNEKVISNIHEPLLAMAGTPRNVRQVSGGPGAASSVKMINQLLAGVHITAAAEAMAFATRLELDLAVVYDIIKKESGWSWTFENRVPQILAADWTPFSSLAIFVKDMDIVAREARRLGSFAPISSTAYTLYLEGAAKDLTNEADIGVYRLWPYQPKAP